MMLPHIYRGDPMKTIGDATFLTPHEVADFLRVSRCTIYRMIDEGTIKAIKMSRDKKRGMKSVLRIAREDLQSYIAQHWED